MDHFNAMFEDATTKSWWRQVSGKVVAGPLKGSSLSEVPSQQLTLSVWLRQHPNSLILQPDSLFNKDYADLADFDRGTIKSGLEKRDSASWKPKSWVIGVAHNNFAKAYDWNKLTVTKIIQDSLPGLPIIIALEKDTVSFHVWNRIINGNSISFSKQTDNEVFHDLATNSTWNMNGLCVEGFYKGQQLQPVQSYQEFWHSWITFHPNTIKF